ncbi:MAG: hypothetical protein AAFV25_25375, partial [Bacteroidota bacterium]
MSNKHPYAGLLLLCLLLYLGACQKDDALVNSSLDASSTQQNASAQRGDNYTHSFLNHQWPDGWASIDHDWLGIDPQLVQQSKQSLQSYESLHPGGLELVESGIGHPVWEALARLELDDDPSNDDLQLASLPLVNDDASQLTGLLFFIQLTGQATDFLLVRQEDIVAFQDTNQLEEDLRALLPNLHALSNSYSEWFFPEQRRASSRGDCTWPWDRVKCPSAAGGKSRFKKWFSDLFGGGGNGPSGGRSQTTVITSSSDWLYLLGGGNSNIPDERNTGGGGSKYDQFCHKPKEELGFEEIGRMLELLTDMVADGSLASIPQDIFHIARADCFDESVNFADCLQASFICDIKEDIPDLEDELIGCLEGNLDLLVRLHTNRALVKTILKGISDLSCEELAELLDQEGELERIASLESEEDGTDCHSFDFRVTTNSNYQSCGVIGIWVNFISSYYNGDEWRVEYRHLVFNTLYFEMPHIRFDGTV